MKGGDAAVCDPCRPWQSHGRENTVGRSALDKQAEAPLDEDTQQGSSATNAHNHNHNQAVGRANDSEMPAVAGNPGPGGVVSDNRSELASDSCVCLRAGLTTSQAG